MDRPETSIIAARRVLAAVALAGALGCGSSGPNFGRVGDGGTCGTVGLLCCSGVCAGAAKCVQGVCVPSGTCGSLGLACCAGNMCTDGASRCTAGFCVPTAATCGTTGLPCCGGTLCSVGRCTNGFCVGGTGCGTIGRPCCTGNSCTTGTCTAGFCVPTGNCGQADQPCCNGTTCVATGTTCQGGFCLPTANCGQVNQACCAGNICNGTGTVCTGGFCLPVANCGQINQACCGGVSCAAGLVCSGGTCISQPCGSIGLPCCNGVSCSTGVCTTGICSACGAFNQGCCAGNLCNGGLTCTNGFCTQPMCGAINQSCCNGTTCNGGLTCSGGRCVTVTRMPTGSPCTQNADCMNGNGLGQPGQCLKVTGMNPTFMWPGGYCSSTCRPSNNDVTSGVNPDCPGPAGGATCLNPGNGTNGICLTECAKSSDCRTSYACFNVGSISLACEPLSFSQCNPAQAGSCGGGMTCVNVGDGTVGACYPGCNPFTATGCPNTDPNCYASDVTGEGLCLPAGGTNGGAGATCTSLYEDCKTGYGCLSGRCYKYCNTGNQNTQCSGGGTCMAFPMSPVPVTVAGICSLSL